MLFRFNHRLYCSAITLCLAVGFIPIASAQDQEPPETEAVEAVAPAKRPVRPEDYGEWENLGFRSSLSKDGRWLAYSVRKVEGSSELRLRMLATDSTQVFPFARGPQFSADGKWLAFSIGVHPDKARDAKSPIRTKLGLHDLITGKTTEIENVQSFRFSDLGGHLIMRRYPVSGKKSRGSGIVVRHLATGIDTAFGNVSEYSFNDDGTLLALVIDAEDKAGNGVQIFDVATGRLRTLISSNHNYRSLSWRKDATDLVVLRENEHKPKEDASFVVLAWPKAVADHPKLREFDPAEREDFTAEHRIVDFRGVRWSEDGEYLYFGIKEWENKPKPDEPEQKEETEGDAPEKKKSPDRKVVFDPSSPYTVPQDDPPSGKGGAGKGGKGKAEKGKSTKEKKPKSLRETLKDPAGVEVWHARDVDIIPKQKRQAGRERRQSWLSAWHVEQDKFCQIENELTERAQLTDNPERALGLDNTPFDEERRFGPTRYDVYRIHIPSGARHKLLGGVKFVISSGPKGRYVVYVHDDDVHLLDLESAESRNLTKGVPTHFINQEMSQLTDQKPAYGVAGWSERGDKLYLYDRFDLWEFSVSGRAEPKRLTRGAEDEIRHRRVRLDFEKDEFLSADRPIYLSLYGQWTKKSGYAVMDLGDRPEVLIFEDRSVGGLTKAEDADVYAYTAGSYSESPNVRVANAKLESPKVVSDTNPQQKDFLWGKSQLVDFESASGERLQGALTYPANYEPGKQYPMIVYIYELVSQNLHRYSTPTETSPYNPAVWSSEGYFVFQPDIVYRAQNPGLSAVDCLVPAVKAAVATGMVDKDRVALIGHSWGAYQTAFVVTQTDVFAAGVAGAPLTNMISMSMSIYWNSGETDAWIFHESQGRMDRPFWEDPATYIKNSPIFSIDQLNTPLLVAFGDDDGAVDFNQGVEMYNAARLAKKPFVMLVYPGENHGLRQRPNQVDYHYRILEWCDHYLKDSAPKPWITEGQSFLDRQKEIEESKKSSAGPGARGPGSRRR